MLKKDPKEKIKVLRIIARLNIGGPARHVIILNSGLNKKRFSSHLVAGAVSEGEGDITHMAREMDIEPLIIPELRREIKPYNDFKTFIKLFRLIRRLRPDIVHTHTAKAGALGRIAAILNRVPIRIHTFHGHVFHSYFGRIKTGIFMVIERILALFTNRIVVIGRSQFNDVRDRYRIAHHDKCSIIPLGLDLQPFLNSTEDRGIRRELSIDKDTLLVGIVGRLVNVKNHKMFLDVVKKVKSEAPDIKVKFIIVGGGDLEKKLKSYAGKQRIDDVTIFTGWRTDLVLLYKALDIVCLTSLNEGTPISLIEAMASGKPVLSTDVGGVRDVIADDSLGLLSPSNNVDRYSLNLISLLRDGGKREELGRNAREFVLKRFSKKRLIDDIEKLYEKELMIKGERR